MDKKELLIDFLKDYKNLVNSGKQISLDDEPLKKEFVSNVSIRCYVFSNNRIVNRINVFWEDDYSQEVKDALELEFGDDVRIDRLAYDRMSVIAIFKN